MVGDVDALQGLYVRGLTPPFVALVVGTACVVVTAVFLPAAAVVLAVGLVLVGVLVPVLAARLSRAAGRRQGAARADLTAELVELLRGAPELVVYGREEDTLASIRTRSDELTRLGRRDALAAGLAEGLSILIAGLTVAGVLAVAAPRRSTGCSSPRSHCWPSPRSSACCRCGPPPSSSRPRSQPVAACSTLPTASRRSGTPTSPTCAGRGGGRRARGRYRALRSRIASRPAWLRPQARAGTDGCARGAERRRQDDGHESAAPLPRPGGGPGDAGGP